MEAFKAGHIFIAKEWKSLGCTKKEDQILEKNILDEAEMKSKLQHEQGFSCGS